jgi:ribosomal protein L7/L12
LLDRGEKVEAIKLYREQTGAGLRDAKDAVEAIGAGRPVADHRTSPGPVDPGFEAELVKLLRSGRKIQAIQRHRERTGTGLKEAKDAVERLERGEGLERSN